MMRILLIALWQKINRGNKDRYECFHGSIIPLAIVLTFLFLSIPSYAVAQPMCMQAEEGNEACNDMVDNDGDGDIDGDDNGCPPVITNHSCTSNFNFLCRAVNVRNAADISGSADDCEYEFTVFNENGNNVVDSTIENRDPEDLINFAVGFPRRLTRGPYTGSITTRCFNESGLVSEESTVTCDTDETLFEDCPCGDGICTAFVTSTTYPGNLTIPAGNIDPDFNGNGVQAGDLICQDIADSVYDNGNGDERLNGTFRAWLSIGNGNFAAINRFDIITNISIPYETLNSVFITPSLTNITNSPRLVPCQDQNNCLLNPINIIENGSLLSSTNRNVWTGTLTNGLSSSAGSCSGWSSNSFSGFVGFADETNFRWTSPFVNLPCNPTPGTPGNRLYCFEQQFLP